MNRDEIMVMPAGIEMDTLIAREIFKKKIYIQDEMEQITLKVWETEPMVERFMAGFDLVSSNRPRFRQDIPHYSVEIMAAWKVVEHFPDGVEILRCPDGYICYIYTKEKYNASGKTAPLAICRAALLSAMTRGEEYGY